MTTRRPSRRAFLAGLGLGPAMLPALPLLDRSDGSAGRARAAEARPPKRLVIIQKTNGVLQDSFYPKGTELDFTLSDQLSPLEPWKKSLIVLKGVDLRVFMDDPIERQTRAAGHTSMGALLTGAFRARGPNVDAGRVSGVGNGISVDQAVARAIMARTPTPFKSLELMGAIYGQGKDEQRSISFNGPALGSDPARSDENPPEPNPYKVWDKLFAGARAGESPAVVRQRNGRKSLIAAVGRDLEGFGKTLGAEPRQQIELHLASLQQLERDLFARATGCDAPALEPGKAITTAARLEAPVVHDNLPWLMKAHLDMTVAALACDATRVVTLSLGSHGSDWEFPWLGAEFTGKGDEFSRRNYHDMAHRAGTSPDHVRRKNRVDKYFVEQLAYFLTELGKRPDGAGTLADSTLVLFTDHMGNGGAHSTTNVPMILVGSAGGYFKTGRFLDLRSAPHNGVLCAIANAMDVPAKTFGNPEYGGELAALRG
jgi:hypothetical protein